MTDSWGIALLLAALIAALTVLERGERWLPCWVAVLGVLSVTRETSIVAVGAACLVAALTRTRRALWLAVSGVAVSIPALTILGAPLRETLAYTLNNFEPPADPSWSFVAHHYLPGLKSTIEAISSFRTSQGGRRRTPSSGTSGSPPGWSECSCCCSGAVTTSSFA